MAISLGLLLWWLHPLGVATYPLASTPKEVVSVTSAASVAAHDTPRLQTWPGDIPEDLPIEAVVPSDSALLNNKVVPTDFSGAYLLNVAAVRGGPGLLRALAVLEVLALAGLVGFLTTEISGRPSAGVLAAMLVAASPAVISSGLNVALHDTLAAAFLVAGIVLAIRYDTSLSFIVAGILVGLSVVLRYPNVLLLPITGFFVYRYRVAPPRTSDVIRALLAVVVTTSMVAIPVHLWLYGEPFAVGAILRLDLVERIGQGTESQSNVLARAWRYITIYTVPSGWAAFALLGTAGLVDRRRKPGNWNRIPPTVLALAATGTALFLMISLGPTTYGIDRFRVNASVLRYMLPLQMMMVIPTAAWVRSSRRTAVFTGVMVTLAFGLFVIGVFGEGGVQSQRARRDFAHRAIVSASHEFDDSRLTLVSRVDTLFWPMYHSLNPAHLGAGSPRVFDDMDYAHFYDGVASPDVLAERMIAVAESGRAVVLVEDFSWPDKAYLASLSQELRERGYTSGDPIELGPMFRAHPLRSMSMATNELQHSSTTPQRQ